MRYHTKFYCWTIVLLLTLFLLFNFSSALHYSIGWVRVLFTPDITQKAIYQRELKEIQTKAYDTHYDLGILGDSLAHALKPTIMKDGYSLSLLNLGIPGETSRSLLQRRPQVENLEIGRLYLLIGTNDIGRNVSNTETIANVTTLIDYYKQHTALTLLLIPFSDGWNRNNKKILEMNKVYSRLCVTHQIDCLDLNATFSEHQTLLKKYSSDGLHFNQQGQKKFAEVISKHFTLNN